jgi:hypothetical protein
MQSSFQPLETGWLVFPRIGTGEANFFQALEKSVSAFPGLGNLQA